jgi:hypothetical protein
MPGNGRVHSALSRVAQAWRGIGMFFFFSNRIGCLGSILVSLILTGILLAILGVF